MNPPKMPIHIGDYKRDTGHLRAALHGAYLLLLFHHWSTGALPADDEQLSAIACMTRQEWKKAKPVIEKFFEPGWVHDRVLIDLADAKESYEKLASAGSKGGKARAENKRRSSEASSNATSDASSDANSSLKQPLTFDQKKDSEASASGAGAPIDHRKRLFNEGLSKLATMTGKGPDACRSFVGKCLRAASDDAITVLGLIEDAERNQVVDPSAWIAARLKSPENGHAKPASKIIQAADDLRRKIASFDGPAGEDIDLRDGQGPPVARLLSHG